MSWTEKRLMRFAFEKNICAREISIPPPLPLMSFDTVPHKAKTGIESRPMYLPIRRHTFGMVSPIRATAAEQFESERSMKLEPILMEAATLQKCGKVLERVLVYAYNEKLRASECDSDTLRFDSLFECGNLQRAYRVFRAGSSASTQEYELILHPDVGNNAYRQWFYFEVQRAKRGIEYVFSIVNMAKSGALFGSGLQPVVYSESAAQKTGLGWTHGGFCISYDVSTSEENLNKSNTLSFHYSFAYDNDTVFFACLQSYSYTDLSEYLEALQRDPKRGKTMQRTQLCLTIAQNVCDLLTITDFDASQDTRRIIVLSARVHPGEANSSWMMKGMIDYLTSDALGANLLRKHFIFKIVPMLNPDGVIHGNTRVNLAGWDLNRKWTNPIESLFPTVYHLKQCMRSFQSRIALFCDLHGHSLHRNIFMYGCHSDRTSMTKESINVRAFPKTVASLSNFFSYANCDFHVPISKISTARFVVFSELNVERSYTLEASFCGPDFGERKDTQFSTLDLEEMGRQWCQSLLLYMDKISALSDCQTRNLHAFVRTAIDLERVLQKSIASNSKAPIMKRKGCLKKKKSEMRSPRNAQSVVRSPCRSIHRARKPRSRNPRWIPE